MTTARPALDPELRELLADIPLMPQLDAEGLARLRQFPATPVDSLLAHRQVERREITVPAKDGTAIPLSVLSPTRTDRTDAAPCVYWMHGGGMVMGDRFSQLDIPLEWLDECGAVVVSVDYRLAPEATGTTPVDDCYQDCSGSPNTPPNSASTRPGSSSPGPARAVASPPASPCWPAISVLRRSPRRY